MLPCTEMIRTFVLFLASLSLEDLESPYVMHCLFCWILCFAKQVYTGRRLTLSSDKFYVCMCRHHKWIMLLSLPPASQQPAPVRVCQQWMMIVILPPVQKCRQMIFTVVWACRTNSERSDVALRRNSVTRLDAVHRPSASPRKRQIVFCEMLLTIVTVH